MVFRIIAKMHRFLGNCFRVIAGKNTWVGYDNRVDNSHLPALRPAILPVSLLSGLNASNLSAIKHINQLYAKDYQVSTDLKFMINSIRHLGMKTVPK